MKIFVLGDSTACSYTPDKYPQTGWGQVLGDYLPGVSVVNTARGGRSTKSFIAEGRLSDVERQLEPGDMMLIQFTHNDMADIAWRHTEPWTGFMTCLDVFIDTARLHGAVPVLITSIPIRDYRDGYLQDSLGEYPEAVRTAAFLKGVTLLDLYAKAIRKLRSMSESETEGLYMNIGKGVYPGIPDGRTDNVHTQEAGARFYARLIADLMKDAGLI